MQTTIDPTVALSLSRDISSSYRDSQSLKKVFTGITDMLGFDCGMLLLATDNQMPEPIVNRLLVSSYRQQISDFLSNEYIDACPGYKMARKIGIPSRMCDTPFDFYNTDTYQQCLGPAGFKEGVTMVLKDQLGGTAGMLCLSSTHKVPLSPEGRMFLTMLSPSLMSIIVDATLQKAEQVVISVDLAKQHVELHKSGTPELSAVCTKKELLRLASELVASGFSRMGFYQMTPEQEWLKIGLKKVENFGGATVIFTVAQSMPPANLTFRELQVANLVCYGLTNSEIAGMLSISLSTVKTHLEKLHLKMGVTRRAEIPIKVCQDNLFVRQFRIPL